MPAGNVTPTTAANFIPEIWTGPIDDFARVAKRLLFRVRDVSELMDGSVQKGDTIHVPRISEETVQTVTSNVALTFNATTDPKTDLLINQHKAVAKRIENIAQVQANMNLVEMYASPMAYALVKHIETFIADLLQTSTAHDVSLTTDNQMTAAEFREGEQNLMDEDWDLDMMHETDSIYLYSSPAIKQFLKGLGVFTDFDKTGSPGTGLTGRFSQVYGTLTVASTDWDSAGTTGEEAATLFSRLAAMVAMQQSPNVKGSDAHAAGFLGTNVTIDAIYGAVLSYPAADSTSPIVNFNNP